MSIKLLSQGAPTPAASGQKCIFHVRQRFQACVFVVCSTAYQMHPSDWGRMLAPALLRMKSIGPLACAWCVEHNSNQCVT